MPTILVSDPLAPEGLERLRALGEVLEVSGKDPEALAEAVPRADAWVVRSGTRVTAEWIERGTRLKVIARAGAGVDNIDVAAATARGIWVVNAPGANAVAVAELTFGLLIALFRHIREANASLREGRWERKRFQGLELRGKTLGLLGLGRVGSEVARRARAFGMEVLAYDPYVPPERAEAVGARLADLEAVLAESHVLSLHMALTEETRGFVNADLLARCRDGVYLLNLARGELVDEAALLDALESGKVAGAGLDVLSQEPPPADHPLLQHPRVIVTPHLGASTREAQVAVAVHAAEEVARVLRGEAPTTPVNRIG